MMAGSMRSFLRLLKMEFEDKRIPRKERGVKIRQCLFGRALWRNQRLEARLAKTALLTA